MKRLIKTTTLLLVLTNLILYNSGACLAKDYKSEDSPYGMTIGTGPNFWEKVDQSYYPTLAKDVYESGAGWVRLGIRQADFDPETGNFDIKQLDNLTRSLLNHGLKVSASITLPRKEYDTYYPGGLRENWQEWEGFLKYIVNRYGNEKNWIHYWFLENETDHWQVVKDDKDLYLEIIERSYPIVKESDSQAHILSTSFTQLFLDDGEIVDYWLSKGLCNYFEAFTFNFYFQDNKKLENYIDKANHLLKKNECPQMPVWIKETNTHKASMRSAQKYLKERYEVALSQGVERVFWYHVLDSRNGPGILSDSEYPWPEPGRWANFQGFYQNDLFKTYQKMAVGSYKLPEVKRLTARQVLNDSTLELSWSAGQGGSRGVWNYVVHVASKSDPWFFQPKIYRFDSSVKQAEIKDLAIGTYLIRVKAIDDFHYHGPWSSIKEVDLDSWKDIDQNDKIDRFDLTMLLGSVNGGSSKPVDGVINSIDALMWIHDYQWYGDRGVVKPSALGEKMFFNDKKELENIEAFYDESKGLVLRLNRGESYQENSYGGTRFYAPDKKKIYRIKFRYKTKYHKEKVVGAISTPKRRRFWKNRQTGLKSGEVDLELPNVPWVAFGLFIDEGFKNNYWNWRLQVQDLEIFYY